MTAKIKIGVIEPAAVNQSHLWARSDMGKAERAANESRRSTRKCHVSRRWKPKIELARKEKIWQRRLAEDKMFADALAEKP